MMIDEIKALTFDVFGTVVDYHSTIVSEGERLAQQKEIQLDWDAFVTSWRGNYDALRKRFERHEIPWTKSRKLYRSALDETLHEFHLTILTEDEKEWFAQIWQRLHPWPDSVAGLMRLRQKYVLATLSNGDISQITHMAKYSELPWDCILSVELVQAYKPDPRVYQKAIELLDLPAEQIMLVAAHPYDLRAARTCGYKTAYIPRPLEHGSIYNAEAHSIEQFDLVASDMLDLASQLGT